MNRKRSARILVLASLCLWTSAGVSQAQPDKASNIASKTQWMAGTWTGIGSQSGTGSSWSIQLTVQQQGTGGYSYKIDYPSLNCGGYWTLTTVGRNSAGFTEHIVYGREKCVDLGTISVGVPESQGGIDVEKMAFHWTGTQPNGNVDNAGATLTRSPSK